MIAAMPTIAIIIITAFPTTGATATTPPMSGYWGRLLKPWLLPIGITPQNYKRNETNSVDGANGELLY